MESLYFSPGCAVGSQVCHDIMAPRHPGTPSWVMKHHGTRSRSCLPSWCRRSGWPGVRTPASQSSGPSTDTPLERRSHRAKRDSARSAGMHKIIFLYCMHILPSWVGYYRSFLIQDSEHNLLWIRLCVPMVDVAMLKESHRHDIWVKSGFKSNIPH